MASCDLLEKVLKWDVFIYIRPAALPFYIRSKHATDNINTFEIIKNRSVRIICP